jgi:hypothetical protein
MPLKEKTRFWEKSSSGLVCPVSWAFWKSCSEKVFPDFPSKTPPLSVLSVLAVQERIEPRRREAHEERLCHLAQSKQKRKDRLHAGWNAAPA